MDQTVNKMSRLNNFRILILTDRRQNESKYSDFSQIIWKFLAYNIKIRDSITVVMQNAKKKNKKIITQGSKLFFSKELSKHLNFK